MTAHNYKPILEILEDRLKASKPQASFADTFADIDDDLFAFLLLKDFDGYPNVKAALPDWPPDAIRIDSVGNFPLAESVKEALSFYKRVREWQSKYGNVPFDEASVLDYGCGWGRMLRVFGKNVLPDKLYGCDPNPVFIDFCKSLRVPGNIRLSDWESRQRAFDLEFDLAYCFSVFTHTSEILQVNILERLAEMLTSDGLLIATVRPGSLIESVGGEMEYFTEEEKLDWLRRFEKGSFLYKPYPGSIHWGITVIPEDYLAANWTKHFELLEIACFYQNWTQVPVILRRK